MPDAKMNLLNKTTSKGLSRKRFLKYAGTSAATVIAFGLTACSDDNPMNMDENENEIVSLGSGDVGILNYAYALEQLEAAFYIAVLDSAYSGMSAEEGQILEDLRDHEVAHRDWLKAAISSVAPNDINPGLTPDFSAVDFSDRSSVLATAQALEDTGVRAYKGQAPAVQGSAQVLTAAFPFTRWRRVMHPKCAGFAG